ncbi:MAG: hypothetical protein ACOC53_00445 [Candidatus Saliniplasma sp.]
MKKMEMMSGCHICGKATTRSCSLCGLATCEEHLEKGICNHCRKGKMSQETDVEKMHYENKEVNK